MGRPVMQWQILARDPEKAAGFYRQMFGWEINANNALGYRQADTCSERGIQGGFWPCPPEGQPMVTLYVEVEDVAASVAQCQALGGKVVFPPQVLPDGDEMAIILDAEGLPLGLFRSTV